MLLHWTFFAVIITQCLGRHQDFGTLKSSASSGGDDISATNPIDDIIRGLIESFRANMSQGFPQWGLPPLDPLHIDNLPIAIDDEGAISLHANISNADVADLSKFEIASLHTNILTLELQLALNLSDVNLTCSYYLDGVIAGLFPLYGAGPCSVVLSDITVSVDADLKHNRTDGNSHIQIDTMDFNLAVKGLNIEMHNLFNSEDLAKVIDGFANDFGPLLIDVLVNDTRRDLMPTIIEELNKLLWNVSMPFMENQPTILSDNRKLLSRLSSSANADAFFDRLMPYLQNYITASHLDPFTLPEISAEVLGNTGVKLYDGYLSGLSGVARSGGSQMTYDESEWLTIGSGIGFQQLAGGYKLKIEVFGIGPHVSADVQLVGTRAEFDAQISSQSLVIKLNKLRIADIGDVHVQIHGLGFVFEFLVSPLIGLVASLFKGQIADAISGALFDALDGVLSQIDLLQILENL